MDGDYEPARARLRHPECVTNLAVHSQSVDPVVFAGSILRGLTVSKGYFEIRLIQAGDYLPAIHDRALLNSDFG